MEAGIGPRLLEGLLEIEAGRHQRLGDEATAEIAEAAVGPRFGHEAHVMLALFPTQASRQS